MGFTSDTVLEQKIGRIYGQYLKTFVSDNGQVRADLFVRGPDLVAYISFPTELDIHKATDRYLGALYDFARQEGYEGRFRMIYS